MRYDSQQVHDWVQQLYQAYGFEEKDARAVAKMITYTDLQGIASYGVQRLSMYDRFIQAGKIDLHAQPEIVFETHVSAVVDQVFDIMRSGMHIAQFQIGETL